MHLAPTALALTLAAAPIAATATDPAPAAPPTANPLLVAWTTPFGMPPFGDIRPEHFRPAFEAAMAAQRAEVAAIAANPAPPTFENTLAALDASGEALTRVQLVFGALVANSATDEIQAIQREMAPRLTRHRDEIQMDDRLFRRVDALWQSRASLGLDPDQAVLLERVHKGFVRSGARLDAAGKDRLKAMNGELTSLGVKFGDNLLAATNGFRLVVDREDQLAGLPPGPVAAAAEAARKAGLPGKWVFTLHAPSYWPFMKYADDRALRKRLFEAYTTRCNQGGPLDNKAIASRTAALRVEKARLLGYPTWADYVLDDQMAGTPTAAYGLVGQLWEPAKRAAAREARALEEAIRAAGKDHPLEPWDWFYYTEKVRKARYDLDETELSSYFPLDRVRDGAFLVANKLYGVTFTELPDAPRHDPEARVFEVKDRDGSHLAVFVVDYHPRPSKRSGAWASALRGQHVRDGKEVRPIVTNSGNFTRPAGGAPALLTPDEVDTLFHELGHGLHSMLSRKRYDSYGGLPRDFVELPSQIMENWAMKPEVLALYARHWKTGETIPAALVEKIQRAQKFDQGFKNTEYLAASLLDLEWHTLSAASEPDAAALERVALARMGMPATIVPRYRTTYFQHVFGPGGGYSAGYYSYKWAEVLDADAFAAFEEKGLFDPATALAFRRLLEKGRSEDPMSLYVKFRGRAPSVEPLKRRLGLGE
jgi:peptidyl-dipeptidase Dcp